MTAVLLEVLRVRRKPLMCVAVLLLVDLCLWLLINCYQMPAIATAQMSWSQLRNKAALVGPHDQATLYRNGLAALATLAKQIPPKRELPRVLEDILDAAHDAHVETSDVSYKYDFIKGQNLLAYSIDMKVTGNYFSVKSFLGDLLNTYELVVVEDVTITNTDVFNEQVTMGIRLTAYLREAV